MISMVTLCVVNVPERSSLAKQNSQMNFCMEIINSDTRWTCPEVCLLLISFTSQSIVNTSLLFPQRALGGSSRIHVHTLTSTKCSRKQKAEEIFKAAKLH